VNILHLDTATSVFSIALTRDETIIGEYCGDAGPAASAKIPGHIQDLLQKASLEMHELHGFSVTVGPGAFTGLRVGIALIKGMAYAAGRPVVALSSLELLALNAKDSKVPVCAMFDARRGEVYAAVYDFSSGEGLLRPERAIDPGELLDELVDPVLFLGDGALRYRDLIAKRLGSHARFAADHLHQPRVSAGAVLALSRIRAGETVTPFELAPSYLRLPEAEINRKGKL
jgi:tRNA threonylcarbamoyladenosine biosynthesis protein TsaB